MSEFVPKTTGDLSSAEADTQREDSKAFTPKQQSVDSQSASKGSGSDTGFKNIQAAELPTISPAEAEPLKNIQVPADKPRGPDEGSGDAAHGSKVNVVRDGDKITQIIVECKCGETIPLDCIY